MGLYVSVGNDCSLLNNMAKPKQVWGEAVFIQSLSSHNYQLKIPSS